VVEIYQYDKVFCHYFLLASIGNILAPPTFARFLGIESEKIADRYGKN